MIKSPDQLTTVREKNQFWWPCPFCSILGGWQFQPVKKTIFQAACSLWHDSNANTNVIEVNVVHSRFREATFVQLMARRRRVYNWVTKIEEEKPRTTFRRARMQFSCSPVSSRNCPVSINRGLLGIAPTTLQRNKYDRSEIVCDCSLGDDQHHVVQRKAKFVYWKWAELELEVFSFNVPEDKTNAWDKARIMVKLKSLMVLHLWGVPSVLVGVICRYGREATTGTKHRTQTHGQLKKLRRK